MMLNMSGPVWGAPVKTWRKGLFSSSYGEVYHWLSLHKRWPVEDKYISPRRAGFCFCRKDGTIIYGTLVIKDCL